MVLSLPSRLVPVDDEAADQPKKRTPTNLYDQRPTWLDNQHRTLDPAAFAAYGRPADVKDEDILERLLALKVERAWPTPVTACLTSVASDTIASGTRTSVRIQSMPPERLVTTRRSTKDQPQRQHQHPD